MTRPKQNHCLWRDPESSKTHFQQVLQLIHHSQVQLLNIKQLNNLLFKSVQQNSEDVTVKSTQEKNANDQKQQQTT